jgi:hypothetical protein
VRDKAVVRLSGIKDLCQPNAAREGSSAWFAIAKTMATGDNKLMN